MLLRGQNLLGYRNYADDVRLFAGPSNKTGIDIIRVFDALNDVRDEDIHRSNKISRRTLPPNNKSSSWL